MTELQRIALEFIEEEINQFNDFLGICEMYPELSEAEVHTVCRLIATAKVEVSW